MASRLHFNASTTTGPTIITNAMYLEHVTCAMSTDATMCAHGLRSLVQMLKHLDKRAVPDTLLYQLAFGRVHEKFGMQMLSVLFRRWPPMTGSVAHWLRTELASRNEVITAYAASTDAAERRWFWKLAEHAWPLDGPDGPPTCCAIQPPMDTIGLLTAYIITDVAKHRPHALTKCLHAATKLARRMIRVPAYAPDAPDRLQKLCKLLLQHHGPLLCKDAQTAGIFAVLVNIVLRPAPILAEPWAALIWALIHCEPTQLLAMLIVEELSNRGAAFMLPLIHYGLVGVLFDHIERTGSPGSSVAATFALTQLATHEFVWVQIMQPEALRRLHTILHTPSICETIRLEMRGLLQECARDPAPFIHTRFKDCGLSGLLPKRARTRKLIPSNKETHHSLQETTAVPPPPNVIGDSSDSESASNEEDSDSTEDTDTDEPNDAQPQDDIDAMSDEGAMLLHTQPTIA